MTPFLITVYDKHFQRQGWLGAPLKLDVTLVQNGISLASFGVSRNSDMIAPLMQPGARAVIDYKGQTVLSGAIKSRSGSGPHGIEGATFEVVDDWRKLEEMLIWPRPTSAIGSQSTTHWKQNGPLETVFKSAVQVNANRIGLPLRVDPSGGRGPTYRASIRFKTPAEEFANALNAANLRSRIVQEDGELVLYVDPTNSWPLTVTAESGVLEQWDWAEEAPSATRVVLGAGGEDTDRIFRARTRTAVESEWGDRIEVWRDARDISPEDEDRNELISDRMNETLDEGGAASGLSVRFRENAGFSFLESYNVGDVLTVEIGPDVRITDRLREVSLSWSEAGVQAASKIGDWVSNHEHPNETLMRAVRAIYRRVRGSETNR